MNNQEQFTTRSNKLKVHRANSQTISSYPVRFSTDIIFSSLVSFAFCVLVFLLFFLIKNIYILIHIRHCGRINLKKISTRLICGNKITFFWPNYFFFVVNTSTINKSLVKLLYSSLVLNTTINLTQQSK